MRRGTLEISKHLGQLVSRARAELACGHVVRLARADENFRASQYGQVRDADNAAGLKNKYQFGKYVAEAMTMMREKKFEESLTTIENALALAGITPVQTQEALMAQGQIYMAQREYDKSMASFKKAIEAAPQGPRVAMLNRLTQYAEQQKAADAANKEQPKADEKN